MQKYGIIETPGHASHNLSFQESFNGGIFPGDAAGTYFQDFDVVAPTTPPPFYLESALASLDRLISFNPTFLYYSHFGKASNAIQRLKDYKEQLQLWAKIAIEGVRNDENLKEICNRILLKTKSCKKSATTLKITRSTLKQFWKTVLKASSATRSKPLQNNRQNKHLIIYFSLSLPWVKQLGESESRRAPEQVPLEKINDYSWQIPKYKPGMRVPGIVFANQTLLREDED